MLDNIQIIYRVKSDYVQSVPKSAEINTKVQKKDPEKLKIFFRHHKLPSAIFHRNNFDAQF